MRAHLPTVALWTGLGLHVLAGPASAQEDGDPCISANGTVTIDGFCRGDGVAPHEAVFCDDPDPAFGTVVVLPCGALRIGEETLVGTCDMFPASGPFPALGAYCTYPEETPCAFSFSGTSFFVGCSDADGNVDADGHVCDLFEGCQPGNPGPFACAPLLECLPGNRLRVDCTSWGQAVTIGCGGFGGTCAPDRGACVLPVNAPCDDALLQCADGLTCVAGLCMDPNGGPVAEGETEPGEGEGEGENGEGEGEPGGSPLEPDDAPGIDLSPIAQDESLAVIDDGAAAGCGCALGGRPTPPWSAVLLLGAALVRRARRSR